MCTNSDMLFLSDQNVEAISKVLSEVEDWEGLANWLDIGSDNIKEDCAQSSSLMMCHRRELVRRYCNKHLFDPNKVAARIAEVLEQMNYKRQAEELRHVQLQFGKMGLHMNQHYCYYICIGCSKKWR